MVWVSENGIFHLTEIQTEYYFFLWVLDMIHDKLVPSSHASNVYYLVDVILYTIATNNPDIDLYYYRNYIWKVVCHYFNKPHHIRKDLCDIDPVASPDTFMGSYTIQKDIFKLLSKDEVNINTDYYIIDNCPLCVSLQGTRIIGLPELWDKLSIDKLNFGSFMYTLEKKNIQTDMTPAEYKIYGKMENRTFLIHDIKYKFNYSTQNIELTLNGNHFTKPTLPKYIISQKSIASFEEMAILMSAKHVKDLGQILYVARSKAANEQIYLFTQDIMFINIACYIFDLKVYSILNRHPYENFQDMNMQQLKRIIYEEGYTMKNAKELLGKNINKKKLVAFIMNIQKVILEHELK